MSYVQARNVILQKAQDAAVLALIDQVARARSGAPAAAEPGASSTRSPAVVRPDGPDAVGGALSGRVRLEPGSDPDELPQPLRAGRARGPRRSGNGVSRDGTPTLVIGTQLLTTRPDGSTRAVRHRGLPALQPARRRAAQHRRRSPRWPGSTGAAVAGAGGAARPAGRPRRAAARCASWAGPPAGSARATCGPGPRCAAPTSWPTSHAPSTTPPTRWSGTSASCAGWRRTPGGSWPTCRTSCARRWPR